MSRFSYREPAWLILTVGLLIGLTAGFGLGWIVKPRTRVYRVEVPAGYIGPIPDPSQPNVLWDIGQQAAEESRREVEAAQRKGGNR